MILLKTNLVKKIMVGWMIRFQWKKSDTVREKNKKKRKKKKKCKSAKVKKWKKVINNVNLKIKKKSFLVDFISYSSKIIPNSQHGAWGRPVYRIHVRSIHRSCPNALKMIIVQQQLLNSKEKLSFHSKV